MKNNIKATSTGNTPHKICAYVHSHNNANGHPHRGRLVAERPSRGDDQ